MSRDSFIQQAFDEVCSSSKEPEDWYVCLMERVPFYAGPEEGGIWSSDTLLVAYQLFQTEELALEAEKKIKKLAKELTNESRKEFGRQCLRQSKWLEDRGLDDNFLLEPDGESEYFVRVCQTLPEPRYGSRHYE